MATLEFLVTNQSSANNFSQSDSSIARLADGSLVAVWRSLDQDGDSGGIYFQRYTADGAKISNFDALANTTTSGNQYNPAVAGLPDGSFVITWTSTEGDFNSTGILAQRFDRNGNKVGPEFVVNSTTVNSQTNSEIAALADGGWVIVWEDSAEDGNQSGVFQQRYNALGTKVGGEEQVNLNTLDRQDDPDIAALPNGGWIVVWASEHLGDNSSIDREAFYQRYNAAGAKVGSETLVSSTTASERDDRPSVAVLNNGDFVVTWFRNAAGDAQVFGQVFRPNGLQRGPIFEISDPAIADESAYAEIVPLSDGGFAVAWQDFTFVDDVVYHRSFDAGGAPRGPQEIVGPSPHRGSAEQVDLVALEDGGYGVIWGTFQNDIQGALFGQATALNDILTLDQAGTIHAKAGDDFVTGSSGADTIKGGSGRDILNGLDGADYIHAGNETFGSTRDFNILSGGQGDDTLIGSPIGDQIDGDDGSDLIRGRAGDDTLSGGGSDDVLRGGAGNDDLSGEGGSDNLFGHEGNDTLSGGDWRDRLLGHSGDDELYGGTGSDRLIGGSGDDLLSGGPQSDRLNGGTGNDLLQGGIGADLFIFSEEDFGEDVISDFQNGIDTLRVFRTVADGFSEVTVTTVGQNAVLEFGGGEVILIGMAGDVGASDFDFV